MTDQETTLANAFVTQLTAEMGPTDLTALVGDIGTLTTPCILVIDMESDSLREYIMFDGVFGASSFVTTNTTPPQRYLAGSAATSNLTHPVGASVQSIAAQQHFEDLNDRIDGADTAIGVVESDFASHEGGTSTGDHPEATQATRGFMSAADKTILDGVSSGGDVVYAKSTIFAGTTLTGTFTAYHTVDIVIPGDWNSYVMIASAKCEALYRKSTTNGSERIYFGVAIQTSGPWSELSAIVGTNFGYQTMQSRYLTYLTVTGTLEIQLRAYQNPVGAGYLSIQNGTIDVIAIRIS